VDLADSGLVVMDALQQKQPEQPPADKASAPSPRPEPRPREIGGRDGPEPTRYGDWEKNGRCIDF
jgi:hypothetical protein